jgi:hypothetical protein
MVRQIYCNWVAATSTYSYTINSGAPVIGQTSPTINLTALGAEHTLSRNRRNYIMCSY